MCFGTEFVSVSVLILVGDSVHTALASIRSLSAHRSFESYSCMRVERERYCTMYSLRDRVVSHSHTAVQYSTHAPAGGTNRDAHFSSDATFGAFHNSLHTPAPHASIKSKGNFQPLRVVLWKTAVS